MRQDPRVRGSDLPARFRGFGFEAFEHSASFEWQRVRQRPDRHDSAICSRLRFRFSSFDPVGVHVRRAFPLQPCDPSHDTGGGETKNHPPQWGRAVSISWYHPSSSRPHGPRPHPVRRSVTDSVTPQMRQARHRDRVNGRSHPSPPTADVSRHPVRSEARRSFSLAFLVPLRSLPRFSVPFQPGTRPRQRRWRSLVYQNVTERLPRVNPRCESTHRNHESSSSESIRCGRLTSGSRGRS
jgi:hypothetical protein